MGPANPERLLLALDENLDHQVQLIIYGRSALWLGFNHPPAVAAATFDVDAIVPDAQVQALADDSRFWDARDAVNQRFKAEGLYITHLFPESEVFLRRDWAEHIIPITRLRLSHLDFPTRDRGSGFDEDEARKRRARHGGRRIHDPPHPHHGGTTHGSVFADETFRVGGVARGLRPRETGGA